MVRDIVVLGGGSAGFIAALTLARKLPHLRVRVVRSAEIGVIGVGEGTTISLPNFFLKILRLKPAQMFAELQPTWKLGLRFLWGPRESFQYTFSRQLDFRWPDLPKNNGYYCDEEFVPTDLWSSLMARDRAFPRGSDGRPDFAEHGHVGFHIENRRLIDYLEARSRDFGVQIIDGTMRHAEKGEQGIAALMLESGERIEADLFVDASGFRAELLGGALEVPFQSFKNALFCDRAVIAGWARTNEPIKPYTTVETMECGWCWQIEHEHWINRGYVFSSSFISDDAARQELLRKNPRISNEPRFVPFRPGRRERMWVGNVVGVGNSSGFVEPLEATSLATIVTQARALASTLHDSDGEPTPSLVALYNRFIGETWDEIRDFLALHYRFNTRLDTPFWAACRADTDLGAAADLVDFYQENGPSGLHKSAMIRPDNSFGLEGYLAMMIGQAVPYRKKHRPTDQELRAWKKHLAENDAAARRGFTIAETLAAIRRPDWRWNS